MSLKIIEGDLIKLAKKGEFEAIAHGCNCFSSQSAGIAAVMSKHFRTDEFKSEKTDWKGAYNKLGTLDFEKLYTTKRTIETYFEDEIEDLNENYFTKLYVCNAYTQYKPGKNLDMVAFGLCLKKLNFAFKGKKLGVPLIGGGIAGGNPTTIIKYMKQFLVDVDLTLVLLPDMYKKIKKDL